MSQSKIRNQTDALRIWLRRPSSWVTILVAVPILTVFAVFAWRVASQATRAKASESLLHTIDSLVLLTPRDRTADEWNVLVYWTHNLHGNSILQVYAKRADIIRLQQDINDRIQSDADTSTILWIWERYAALTECGERYRQKYQSVMLAEMERVAANGDTSGDYTRFAQYVRQRHEGPVP
jgi:drug/metabolite transporter superfamily protein YnfA